MNIKNDRHRAEPKVEMILTGEIRWCFVASGERVARAVGWGVLPCAR